MCRSTADSPSSNRPNRHLSGCSAQLPATRAGNPAEALQSHRDSLAIVERLAQSDPGDRLWQRGRSITYEHIGDIHHARGDEPQALTAYNESLAIKRALAESEPGNAQWQRDVA